MVQLIINPGAEAVPCRTSFREARRNILALLADANVGPDAHVGSRAGLGHEGGRYRFRLVAGNRTCEVDMPGIPLDRVRYLGDQQNAWDFPRLYVDGSSWLWKYALHFVHDALLGIEDA